MRKFKVVKRSQVPTLPPWGFTAFWLLVLEKFDAPGWVWGATATAIAIVWFFSIGIIFFVDEYTELREEVWKR